MRDLLPSIAELTMFIHANSLCVGYSNYSKPSDFLDSNLYIVRPRRALCSQQHYRRFATFIARLARFYWVNLSPGTYEEHIFRPDGFSLVVFQSATPIAFGLFITSILKKKQWI